MNRILWVVAMLFSVAPSAVGQCTVHTWVNDAERQAFVSAAYGKRSEIEVQLLAAEGCVQSMLAAANRRGAVVRFSDLKVGYVLALIPRERVFDFLDVPGAQLVSVRSELYPYYTKDPKLADTAIQNTVAVPPIVIPFPRVATVLSKSGPYFPASEAGLTSFWARHPKADGRGVRVAVVDDGLDLLHPALQVAKNASGAPVPKIADIVTFTHPGEDSGWVQFGGIIQTDDNGVFDIGGRSWTAPSPGAYRFGVFSRKMILGDKFQPKANELTIAVGVLWDKESNHVWVDTDGDGDFRNQKPLEDYGQKQDIDYFGRKDGEGDNRIPFGVKIDLGLQGAYISIANGGHGTWIAGTLAANRLTLGLFDGSAPNAQLIDVRPLHIARLATLLGTFARRDVDVINLSAGIGESEFQQAVLARALAIYNKPLICFCPVAGALFVRDYQSPEMLLRNRRTPPPHVEAIHSHVDLSADGLVNTVLAPSTSLTTESRYMPVDALFSDGKRHITADLLAPPAPAGYGIGQNNSPTISVVSGILADLIGEARRTHVRYDAARLVSAVLASARLVPGFAASQQGFGLINAEAAWKQLARMASVDDPRNSVLTSFSVSQKSDAILKGVNGFQADLAKASKTLPVELWITRHGGYRTGRKYKFGLRGNDGTYQLVDYGAVFVPESPVRVRVSSRVRPGMHVAFLQVRDMVTGVVMQEVPLVVRAPNIPDILAPGVERYRCLIPPRHLDIVYVRANKDVQAARYIMRIPYTGPSAFLAERGAPGFVWSEAGKPPRPTPPPPGHPVDAARNVGPMQDIESLVANVDPGTHVVSWDNRGKPEYEVAEDLPAPTVPIAATLTVSKYAVSIATAGDQIQITNQLARIEGSVEFYDARLSSSVVQGRDDHSFVELRRELSQRLAQFRVAVSSPSLEADAADVFLLDCSRDGNVCAVAAQGAVGAHGVIVAVDDPNPGEWRIVIRARNATASPASFDLREATLTSSSPSEAGNQTHESGQKWLVSVPVKKGDAQYAAFRIAGTPGNERQRNGLRIAVTPINSDAP